MLSPIPEAPPVINATFPANLKRMKYRYYMLTCRLEYRENEIRNIGSAELVQSSDIDISINCRIMIKMQDSISEAQDLSPD